MDLSEARGLVLFRVVREGIGISRRLSADGTFVRLQGIGMLTLEPERLKNQPATTRERIVGMEGLFTGDAQAACDFSFSGAESSLQKLCCRSFDDLESEIGGFALEIVNLQFAMLSVVEIGSWIDELHSVAEHSIDQSSQLGRHSFNGNRSPELSSQSAKLCSQIGV